MRALLLINLQIDFYPGGATGIAGGDQLIPIANELMPQFDLVVAARDWHPAAHCSFASTYLWRRPGQVIQLGERQQLLWQMHCVQESFGAEWMPGLQYERFDVIINKGVRPDTDGYSAFADTELQSILQERGVQEIWLMGMATEHDIVATALDAARLHFKTTILKHACLPLDAAKEAEAWWEVEGLIGR
jgi:nicotinamidase/pyrazinamidase